eukprot:10075-Pelagococcus_subviridis.AAC.1
MRPSSSPAPASARSRRGFDAAAAAVPAPPCIAARVFSLGGVSGASMMDPTAEASGAGVGCHTRSSRAIGSRVAAASLGGGDDGGLAATVTATASLAGGGGGGGGIAAAFASSVGGAGGAAGGGVGGRPAAARSCAGITVGTVPLIVRARVGRRPAARRRVTLMAEVNNDKRLSGELFFWFSNRVTDTSGSIDRGKIDDVAHGFHSPEE